MSDQYHEIIVDGPVMLIKGFVTGMLIGMKEPMDKVIYGEDEQVQCDSLMEQLASWAHLQPTDAHLIVEGSVYPEIVRGLEKAKEPVGLNIRTDRPIASASFRFSYTAYSPQHAADLDKIVHSSEGMITLEGYESHTASDESAHGVELYSPVHEFEFDASGTACGDFKAVLDLHRKAREEDFITLDRITLDYV